MAELTRFKYKPLNDKLEEQGMFSKKGTFDGNTLTLGKDRLDIESIHRVQHRFKRMIFEIHTKAGVTAEIISITKGDPAKLAKRLNQVSSARSSQIRMAALKKQANGLVFRSEKCPACDCTVDLTGFPVSQQIHCSYCDVVSTLDEPRPHGEHKLRACDACGYYAMPRPFTEFYFYFLFVIYGYRYQKKHQCHSCMRSEAWKMFFYNFLFILGVPVAISQLIRAYRGGTAGAKSFPGLDAANAAAKGKKFEQADQAYQNIINNLPAAAGVHYDRALCWTGADDWTQVASACEASLKDCSNYLPAAQLLGQAYTANSQSHKLEQLKMQWNPEEHSKAKATAASPSADVMTTAQ